MSDDSRRSSMRPWRKLGSESPGETPGSISISSARQDLSSLIPETYIEIGQQRLIVVGLLVVVQACKLYEVTWPGSGFSPESIALKYTLIDGIFLLCLPILRIPWLTFTRKVVCFQIIGMCLVNVLLGTRAISLGGTLIYVLKMFEHETSLSGSRIHANEFVDTKSHFTGKYTVSILPESTALLNPTYETFCIRGSTPISIPVRLNATEPIYIQLKRIGFDTLEESYLNFSKSDLRKLRIAPLSDVDLDGTDLTYISLPVDEPGLYRLNKVTDMSRLDVRPYPSDVLVASCPEAYFVGSEDQSQHRCIGDIDTPKLVVDGVPPLKVKYSRTVKGRESLFSVQSVQPDHFVSPLPQGSQTEAGFVWTKGSSLDWATSRTVEVGLDTTVGVTGEWIYNVDAVEDSFGNSVNYTGIVNSRSSTKLQSSRNLSYGFTVHSRPEIRFTGCNSIDAVKLPQGRSVELPIYLQGDVREGPYIATFERTPLEDMPGAPQKFYYEFQGRGERITVDEPGVYTLQNLTGRFCPGVVVESSSCLVYVPPQPTVDIAFHEIEDKCAGPTGVRADLSLTGNPPFMVSYRILRDGVALSTQTHEMKKSRDQIEFVPDTEGEYVYEFFTLSDDIYKGITLDGATYRKEQSIKVLAGASFAEKEYFRQCCSGDTVKLNVSLHGIPPLKLVYEVVSGNSKRVQYVASDIMGYHYQIETPPLASGGRFSISLVSVEDSRGCQTPLSDRDVVVEVRRQRPAAAFLPIDGRTSISVLEGRSVGLPLRLSGEPPWTVLYRYEGESVTQDLEAVIDKTNGHQLWIRGTGNYTLTGLKDAYCPGDITRQNTVEVSWIEKPSMSVVPTPSLSKVSENAFKRKDVCEGDEDAFEISLEGKFCFFVQVCHEVTNVQVLLHLYFITTSKG
jgi:nucleoporin POM152